MSISRGASWSCATTSRHLAIIQFNGIYLTLPFTDEIPFNIAFGALGIIAQTGSQNKAFAVQSPLSVLKSIVKGSIGEAQVLRFDRDERIC